ncbi:hypothetical protein OAO87_03705 [bacterium]|nr:hypothetical protein [bacterium]
MSNLVDKAMKTHSKCDCCAWFGARLFGLQGKVDLLSCSSRAPSETRSEGTTLSIASSVRTSGASSTMPGIGR